MQSHVTAKPKSEYQKAFEKGPLVGLYTQAEKQAVEDKRKKAFLADCFAAPKDSTCKQMLKEGYCMKGKTCEQLDSHVRAKN